MFHRTPLVRKRRVLCLYGTSRSAYMANLIIKLIAIYKGIEKMIVQ